MKTPRMEASCVGDGYKDSEGNLWQMQSYCAHPTATLIRQDTGEELSGAVGCLLFDGFVHLIPEVEER